MRLDDLTISEALTRIASKSPTPGGGSVAPIVAALGSALAEMVLRFSEGKKSLADHAALHEKAIQLMEALRNRALDLAEADARAYGELNALWKLDAHDPVRKAKWSDAVAAAIDVPMQVMTLCNELLAMIERLIGKTTKSLDSDLAIAAVLAEAAARSAAWNVRINLPYVEDQTIGSVMKHKMQEMLANARVANDRVERTLSGIE